MKKNVQTLLVLVLFTVLLFALPQVSFAIDCFLYDLDYDSYSTAGGVCGPIDCNDSNRWINPGMPEIPFNGLDDDCNPDTTDDCADNDGDGYGDGPGCLGLDCNDRDAEVNPSVEEINGNCKDDDCNPNTSDEKTILEGWYIECLDKSNYTNVTMSLAIDPSDNVHISYNDYLNVNQITYITNASGAWVSDIVDTASWYASMAIDSSGISHVIYYKHRVGLNHAENSSGTWSTETLDSIGWWPALAVDAQDNLHIIYLTGTFGRYYDLKYASNKSGEWIIETLVNNVLQGSIAIDSSDNVHIAYHDRANRNLKYITNLSGAWIDEIIDDSTDAGQGSIIAIDSSDNVHINYQNFDPDRVGWNHMYATNKTGSWAIENLYLLFGSSGNRSSMALDSFDKVHISYINKSSKLHYITNISSLWESQEIDPFKIKQDTSIKVDALGNVHIGYYALRGGLKYATKLMDIDSDGTPDNADNCPDEFNPDQLDSDIDGSGNVCDECPFDSLNDSDNDGVCGDIDECVDSDLSEIVVINGCDSSVENTLLVSGCTISDLVSNCAISAEKHGEFRRCVSRVGNSLQKDGIITPPEKDLILSCAGRTK
jgi:hypothetical protein